MSYSLNTPQRYVGFRVEGLSSLNGVISGLGSKLLEVGLYRGLYMGSIMAVLRGMREELRLQLT